MSDKDFRGDRSHLQAPFEVLPLTYTYVPADDVWVPQQSQILGLEVGVGDSAGDDSNYNFSGTKDASLTSLHKGGYIGKETHFALCGLAIELQGPARTVVLSGSKVDLANAGTTLAIRQDTESLTEKLYRAALDLARLSLVVEDESCETYLDNLTAYPAGVGLDDAGPNNGVAVKGNERFFGRMKVLTPQSVNGSGQNIKFTLNHAGRVFFDPSFAEPGAVSVALFLRVRYLGYFCDKDGNPVGQAADPNGYAIFQRFAAGGGRCF